MRRRATRDARCEPSRYLTQYEDAQTGGRVQRKHKNKSERSNTYEYSLSRATYDRTMVSERFRSPYYPIWTEVVGACYALYGVCYGIFAYAGPTSNYFFGPNGMVLPVASHNKINDLDPVSAHYTRVQGALYITLILSYYIFAIGDLEREQRYMKSFLIGAILQNAVNIQTAYNDTEALFTPGLLNGYIIFGVLVAVFQYHRVQALIRVAKTNKAQTSTSFAPGGSNPQSSFALFGAFACCRTTLIRVQKATLIRIPN